MVEKILTLQGERDRDMGRRRLGCDPKFRNAKPRAEITRIWTLCIRAPMHVWNLEAYLKSGQRSQGSVEAAVSKKHANVFASIYVDRSSGYSRLRKYSHQSDGRLTIGFLLAPSIHQRV